MGTVPRSMIPSKMKSYRVAGDGRVAQRALRMKSWSFLVRVDGRRELFSFVMMKLGVPWVPLAADLEPLIGYLGILISGVHGLSKTGKGSWASYSWAAIVSLIGISIL